MVRIHERPVVSPEWVYPCSVEDLEQQLARMPEEDLEGLAAVVLTPATRKYCQAYGSYCYYPKPVIRIYSCSAAGVYKLPPWIKTRNVRQLYRLEREHGMWVEPQGGRWLLRWDAEAIRRLVLEYTLPHEIGHHVYHRQRCARGYEPRPFTRESEQFAHDYALRWRRRRSR